MTFPIKTLFLLLILTTFLKLNAQDMKVTMFNEEHTGYEKNGAVKASAGIIGDKYLSVESDYGGFDFKNNINTFITAYSLKNGKQVNRFSLNELAAASSNDVDDIYFSRVFVWKNKIVGFYSLKYKKEDIFPVKAVICDVNGKLIKKVDFIGDRYYGGVNTKSAFLVGGEYQTDLSGAGRSILLATEGYSFSMSADSSHLAVISGLPDLTQGKIKIRIFNPDLELVKEINPAIKNMDESSSLRKFTVDNTGNIFICTSRKESGQKGKKNDYNTITELHIADVHAESTKSFKIDLHGLFPAEINIKFTKQNTPILMGFYTRDISSKNAFQKHGIFSMVIDPKNLSVYNFNKADFSTELLTEFLEEKEVKKGNGLSGSYFVRYTYENPDSGVYFVLQNDYKVVTRHGTTGAMNVYQDMTSGYIVCSIDKTGKIQWSNGLYMTGWNFENKTRGGRPGFVPAPNAILLLMTAITDEKKETMAFVAKQINSNSAKSQQVLFPLTKDEERSDIIEGTVVPMGNGEYAGLIYNTPKKINGGAPVRLFKVRL